MSRRSLPALLGSVTVIATLLLGLAGCGDDTDNAATSTTTQAADSARRDPVVIGIQDFGESKVLAQVYGQALAGAGWNVSYKTLGGYRALVYPAFESGNINFTPEYAASALEFLNSNAGEASSDIDATAAKLRDALKAKNLVAFAAAPAVDTNSLVVTKQTADKYSLKNISDLAGTSLRLGGPQDCLKNPFCATGIKTTYGIDLSKGFTPLDGGGPLTRAALEGGSIDIAVLFSTDSAIAAKGWVVLKDDKSLFAADNVIPVLSASLATNGGESLESLVDRVSEKITTEKLLAMNARFDVDKDDPEAIAKDFLTREGLLG